MGAALKGRNEVVQLLVDRGARLDTRDRGSRDTDTVVSVLAGHTWQAVDYADGLVRAGVQSAIPRPETAALLRKLMTERGMPVPPPNRTIESVCVVPMRNPKPQSSSKSCMILAAGVRLGSYEIRGLIGSGGMGDVYRARDVRLDRDVALKTLSDTWAAEGDGLGRFEREARILASLNHPNVAALYELLRGRGAPRSRHGARGRADARRPPAVRSCVGRRDSVGVS